MPAVPVDIMCFVLRFTEPLLEAGEDAWYRIDVTEPGKFHMLASRRPSGLTTIKRKVDDAQITTSLCFPGFVLANLLRDIMAAETSGVAESWTIETFENEPVVEIVGTCGCGAKHQAKLHLWGLGPQDEMFHDPTQN